MKRSPIKSRRQQDPVGVDLWESVWRRDCAVADGCVARYLGAPGACKNVWGDPARDSMDRPLRSAHQVDHVHEDGSAMALRAKSDMQHLVTLCASHHESWARGHRTEERRYLARFYPDLYAGYIERN